MPITVSILVFLDPFATWQVASCKACGVPVSILVFLDPFATLSVESAISQSTLVSILVFLDSFATARGRYHYRHGAEGFNPCFLRLLCNAGRAGEVLPPLNVSILVFLDPFATLRVFTKTQRGKVVSILVFLDPFATIWR